MTCLQNVGRVGLPILASFIVSACGTFVTETYVNDPPLGSTPRTPQSVQIFTSSPPSRLHVDVALLEVVQTHGLNEQGRAIMIHRLRTRAANMGCDAVVLGGIREHNGASRGSGFDLLDPGSTTMHATCIMFTDNEQPIGELIPPIRHAPSTRVYR